MITVGRVDACVEEKIAASAGEVCGPAIGPAVVEADNDTGTALGAGHEVGRQPDQRPFSCVWVCHREHRLTQSRPWGGQTNRKHGRKKRSIDHLNPRLLNWQAF